MWEKDFTVGMGFTELLKARRETNRTLAFSKQPAQ
jgi:hypothetical protein